MEPYRNLSGNSGVAAYEIDPGSITVEFKTGAIYLYNDQSAGSGNIVQMHLLAVTGQGLATFINRFVRKGYARRLR